MHIDDDEPAASRSLLHYMEKDLSPTQRDLLMSDYAARRVKLSDGDRMRLDDLAFQGYLPTQIAMEARAASLHDVQQGRRHLPVVDVAIVTILPVELRATQRVFGVDPSEYEVDPDGTRYFKSSVQAAQARRDLGVVLTLAESAYDLQAADAVRRILQRWEPRALFLVGIAGGYEGKLSLADVVVPRIITNYEAERLESDNARLRPRTENVPREVVINLNYYDQVSRRIGEKLIEYCRSLPRGERPKGFALKRFRPEVVNGPATIGVGAKLVADNEFMDHLRSSDERLIAVDQESYGFAKACYGRWWAVFRGVSDYANPDKADGWQFIAASTAAFTLKDFLESEYLPVEMRG